MRIFISESLSVNPVSYPEIKIGYHGTDKVFKKFHEGVTFFSRTPEFAASYAEDKAMYRQSDAALYVYECDLSNISFFNASKKEHILQLKRAMPDKVRIHMMYGYADLPVDEAIGEMQGITTIYPIDKKYWKGKSIGASFYYNGSTKIIIDITDDDLIVMDYNDVNRIAEYSGTIDSTKSASLNIGKKYGKYKDSIFRDYNDYQWKMAKKYDDKYGKGYFIYNMDSEEKNKLNELYQKAIEKLISVLNTDEDFHKMHYTLKPIKEKLHTNYQVFESVMEYIAKAGFEGHIAMESYNGVADFTYAVYNGNDVKIIDWVRYRD